MVAVRREYEEDKTLPIVQLLVAKGADLEDVRGNDNLSLLHFASSTGKADIVDLLIANFTPHLNLRDTRRSMTSLHRAAYNDHADVVYRLLVYGADANTVDKDGDSPLKDAKRKDNHLCCKLLEAPYSDLLRYEAIRQKVAAAVSLAPHSLFMVAVLGCQ